MAANWQRPRPYPSPAAGPIDEYPLRSVPPDSQTGGATGAPSLGWLVNRAVPEEAPPPGSVFFAQADTQGIVGAGTVALFPNASFKVDPNNFGVLKSLDLEVTDLTKASNVRFALLINGLPARGFDSILITPAVAALKTRGFDLSLPLGAGAQVDVQVTDVDGAAYTVNCSFFGWQWPQAIDARYRPEGTGVR